MFDELVESSAVKKKTNKGWAVILSDDRSGGVLLVLILIPLIYTQALPKAMLTTLLVAPPPPPPPPPPPSEAVEVVKPVARLITREVDAAARHSEGSRGLQGSGVAARASCRCWRRAGRLVAEVFWAVSAAGASGAAPPPPPPPPKATLAASSWADRCKRQRSLRSRSRSIPLWRARRVFRATLCCTRSSIRMAA